MDPPPSQQQTFLALLETHQRPLRRICWAYGRTAHDRDDLLQEIAGRLWAAFPAYDSNRRFSTWMYRVALNVAIDFQRRQRRWFRRTASLSDSGADLSVPEADDAAKQEQSHELRELLERQNEADRVILLLYLEGHSYRDISEVLGVTESNVGTRLNRLRNSLRRSVQDPSGATGEKV